MVTPEDLERERYEARLKLQRDISSALAAAYEDGLKEGFKETCGIGREIDFDECFAKSLKRGCMIGHLVIKIRLYQRLFERAETPAEQLRALPFDELERLAQRLEAELLHPPSPPSEASA